MPTINEQSVVKRHLLIFALWLSALAAMAQRYEFDEAQLSPQWQFLGQHDASKYELHEGRLRLYGDIFELHEDLHTTFLGLPVADEAFTFETKLSLFDADNGDEAGVCLFRTKDAYVQCCLNAYRGDHRLRLRVQFFGHRMVLADRHVGTQRDVWLRITRSEADSLYRFQYSFDGEKYQQLEAIQTAQLSPVVTGSDLPLLAGLYCFTGSGKYQMGYSFADFDYVDLRR